MESSFSSAVQDLIGSNTQSSFSQGVQDLVGSQGPQSDFSKGVQDLVDSTDPWSSFTHKASQIADQRGFPKGVLLSQAALESAHGTSNFAKNRNNYFGIQAYDSNPDMAAHYQTPEENINAYIDLVTSYPGVKEAIASGSPDAVIRAIKAAGYATDPNYVAKIEALPEFGRSN